MSALDFGTGFAVGIWVCYAIVWWMTRHDHKPRGRGRGSP